MDCRKQTRANASCFPANRPSAAQSSGVCLAFDDSALPSHKKAKPVAARLQLQPKLIPQQPLSFSGAPRLCSELPARGLLAVLPAIVFLLFGCVAFRTVQGQASRAGEVQQLIQQLSQADFDQREKAERQLIEIGSPAVDPLVSSLLDCTPDACSRVKRILQAVAKECDEEALFKALAALQIRFEVPAQRLQPLLTRWAIGQRDAVVARWRQQGAIVVDPREETDALLGMDARVRFDAAGALEVQMIRQLQRERLKIDVKGNDVVISQTTKESAKANLADNQRGQSITERLRVVLNGSLDQNKKLVLDSEQGAAGFENSVNSVRKQPVSVSIGEDWRGEYSDFDFKGERFGLPIRVFEVQKKTIDDSLLTVINEHPLASLTLDECSIGDNVTKTLPSSLTMVEIKNKDNAIEVLELFSRDSSALSRVRFSNSKFGETEADALKRFPRLANIDLFDRDLEKDSFEALASLSGLRQVWIEGCKFPAAEYLEFQRKHPGVGINFVAKAFLGVSSDQGRGIQFGQPREFQPPAQVKDGCVVMNVVAGKAADQAGMKAGDVVLTVGDQKVKNFDELRIAIAQCDVDEEVPIKIRRDGKEETLKATMGSRDDM